MLSDLNNDLFLVVSQFGLAIDLRYINILGYYSSCFLTVLSHRLLILDNILD